jgi:hypothetical protein
MYDGHSLYVTLFGMFGMIPRAVGTCSPQPGGSCPRLDTCLCVCGCVGMWSGGAKGTVLEGDLPWLLLVSSLLGASVAGGVAFCQVCLVPIPCVPSITHRGSDRGFWSVRWSPRSLVTRSLATRSLATRSLATYRTYSLALAETLLININSHVGFRGLERDRRYVRRGVCCAHECYGAARLSE